MPRHVPSIFQICIPQPAENRGLSFFSSKNPGSIKISPIRAPATVHRMCSIRFPEAWGLETVWKTPPWFGPESREGIKALREEAPPRTPDAAHTCQKADDLLDLCRSGSSGLDLVSTHQRYGRSV